MDVTKTCRDLKELTPNAKVACEMFLEECKKQGLNVLITETYRSQERQNYLYEQGRTRAGKVVTWTKSSRHTSRRAWDVCKNIKGQEYSDSAFFKKCGAIAKKLGITWGGTWSTPDTPHFEIPTNWQPPKQQKKDDELIKAVDNIIKSGIKINASQWNDVTKIKLQYVPALIDKLGGLDKLVEKKIISDTALWKQKKYNVNHVRSLIIKYSKTL